MKAKKNNQQESGKFERWLSTPAAILYCKSLGKEYSKTYMIQLGREIGAGKKDDGWRWLFDRDLLKKHIENKAAAIPNNYMSLKNTCDYLGRDINSVYLYIRKGKLETIKHNKRHVVSVKSALSLRKELFYKTKTNKRNNKNEE